VPSILVDAGPLIALADYSDKHHRRVASYLRRFNGRLLTTWPTPAALAWLKCTNPRSLPSRTGKNSTAICRWTWPPRLVDLGGATDWRSRHPDDRSKGFFRLPHAER